MHHATKEEQDGTNPTQRASGDGLFSTSAFTSALRRLLDQATTDTTAQSPAMRQARRRCGQWLVIRRLALGLDAGVVAERTEVGAEALHLLELGLANETIVSEQARDRLVPVLASQQHDEDWVAAVIDGAVGRRDACAPAVSTRLEADLRWLKEDEAPEEQE